MVGGRRRAAAGDRASSRWPQQRAFSLLADLLRRFDGSADPLTVEASVAAVLAGLPARGGGLEGFTRELVGDPAVPDSLLGQQALTVLSVLAPAALRPTARGLVGAAPEELRAELPPWTRAVGTVEMVQGGAILDDAGREAIVHLMFDYAAFGAGPAGPRHLLSMHVDRLAPVVRLLEVRAREPGDLLESVAATYEGRTGVRWDWMGAAAARDLLTAPLMASWAAGGAGVVGLDGAPTNTWLLGARRLELVLGVPLP